MVEITDQEFSRFQAFIFQRAGISLSDNKKMLVSGRLEKRLRHHRFTNYSDYLGLLARQDEAGEVQLAVDLLTTNETYFFREPKHFDLLREWADEARVEGRTLRVWSAACSSGEEVYSIAMVLSECLGDTPWEVIGSDISTRVLRRAGFGHYPVERSQQIPPAYLKRYCLRGVAEQAGTVLVERSLRQRVRFMQVNLNGALPNLGAFDVIFLRNVMIYFNNETKRQVVSRLASLLRSGGHLLIGHSETLNEISTALLPVMPAVYRKP